MVIIDTGFWLALANRRDPAHQLARARFLDLQQGGFITTWCVITETCYLLQQRVGVDAPSALLGKISAGSLQVFDLTQAHCQRITSLMSQYRNLPMDLADASLVVLAEHLGHGRILSVDQRDFNTYRWKNTHPFQNLLI
ncbi:PIN domain-containing protein [Nodosilinea sp. LEGE 07088]|uniref:type II toxin-antitoxin system VapC family toxin n=1 Tax=Nodosilinea sp. LEGE 07088 TaxID=2777968 RepID=UPI00187E8138|nr:PIN domain-containing protein [Nodosilinea sp. LEGE 07088]MBE9139877.1 PIN domain-containing protein [Nodosilinea sp. LEGE 07088]